jgi:hypothetical protein
MAASCVVHIAEPHEPTDSDATTVEVTDYDDFGSTDSLVPPDDTEPSTGKQLATDITPLEQRDSDTQRTHDPRATPPCRR